MVFLGGAISLLICSPWISAALTGARTSGGALSTTVPQGVYPLNRACVVTVDSLSTPKPVLAGDANIVTGFTAPDTVEGTLIRIDADWLVLRGGSSENWIPKNKVMMIHFYD